MKLESLRKYEIKATQTHKSIYVGIQARKKENTGLFTKASKTVACYGIFVQRQGINCPYRLVRLKETSPLHYKYNEFPHQETRKKVIQPNGKNGGGGLHSSQNIHHRCHDGPRRM